MAAVLEDTGGAGVKLLVEGREARIHALPTGAVGWEEEPCNISLDVCFMQREAAVGGSEWLNPNTPRSLGVEVQETMGV